MTDRPALPNAVSPGLARFWSRAWPNAFHGPPLLFQILALLIGGLLVAQLVTLFLTLALPPTPPPSHRLEEIARSLRAAALPSDLEQFVQRDAPAVSGPGWLVSETASADLAKMVNARRDDVRLFFYSPIPFGRGSPESVAAQAFNRADPHSGSAWIEGLLVSAARAQQGPHPAGHGAPGGMPPFGGAGGLPSMPGGEGGAGARGPFPDRYGEGRGGAFPEQRGGERMNNGPGQQRESGPQGQREPGQRPGQLPSSVWSQGAGLSGAAQRTGSPRDIPLPAGQSGPPTPGRVVTGPTVVGPVGGFVGAPMLLSTPQAMGQFGGQSGGQFMGQSMAMPPSSRVPAMGQGLTALPGERRAVTSTTASRDPTDPSLTRADGTERGAGASSAATLAAPAPSAITMPPAFMPMGSPAQALPDVRSVPVDPAGQVNGLALMERRMGLFGLAPPPFVQGDFVAGMRLPDGRWSVVRLAPESFPNTWQRRVLLWFFCALALVTPLGWIFARRLVKPLIGFAQAAEQLGRDPTAPVLALGDGPAEVGRAARAFNQMQSRLRSFVDDRTAMVGAISHDLRTPLTRLRFRIEDVEDEGSREGMIAEVEEMEAMIASVLDFIRNGSMQSPREYVDLPSLVGELAEGWAATGADVTVAESAGAQVVDVDRLAVRRLIGNLVENALKYGESATIRIWNEAQEVFVDVVDAGAGVAPEEQERVFEPFYRTMEARASTKPGTGLGLAVCRSIARNHGGDISLLSGPTGFTARLRLPLAYEQTGKLAA